MSSISSHRSRYRPKDTEVCVGNFSLNTDQRTILDYFEQFGRIANCNFTSATGGYVFISYEDSSMVDECMKSRPHYLNGRHLYVKRTLPVDDEHPRERFETTRDLMIFIDSDDEFYKSEAFLSQLRDYFTSYGKLYACKYCPEKHFSYILIEFADKDSVDRVILDKPHYYNEQRLDVMKHIPSNIEIMNRKCTSTEQRVYKTMKDEMDDENDNYRKNPVKSIKNNTLVNDSISELDLKNEVYRLQGVLETMNKDFSMKRQQLEQRCSDELKQIDQEIRKMNSLKQDLEQEYNKLLIEYKSLKDENDALNEQYITAELENFEITSYYEQILAEEKAKTSKLEAEYMNKSQQQK